MSNNEKDLIEQTRKEASECTDPNIVKNKYWEAEKDNPDIAKIWSDRYYEIVYPGNHT